MVVVVVVVVEGRDQLCLRGLTPFLQDFITHYSYSEVHLVFNGSADGQLVVAGRQMLAHSPALTLSFINAEGDPAALREVASLTKRPQHDQPLHVGTSAHQHSFRKPLFLATISTAIELNDVKEVKVWEKSRWGSWLLLGEDLRPLLTPGQYLPLDNKVTVAIWGRADEGVELWEAYQAAPTLPHRSSKVGIWLYPDTLGYSAACLGGNVSLGEEEVEMEGQNATGGPNVTAFLSTSYPSSNIAARRRDLSGLHLRCLTGSWEPFTRNTPKEEMKGLVNAYAGDIFSLLAETLNFTYNCRQAPDGQFGSLEDGKWTGQVGELVAGRGDVIVTALDKTYQRSAVIDYCHPYGEIT
ncbi:uncharacterized protein LOC126997141 [Eriocheir sinensis]|uniref:uncharacterized protein LOC126997141 n=1 Tax=Eriocheir sinensis TaxID=95602 RepID=UPI0021C77025|nr:uncharacterized protein LOC126997141 [Eriocheir sinensis]